MRTLRRLIALWKSRKIKLATDSRWTSVYSSTDEYIIRIHKLKLEDEGIPVTVFDQRDSSYNAFGYIYLNVPIDYKEQAEKLLTLEHE